MSRAFVLSALASGQEIYCAACAGIVITSKVAENLEAVLDMGCLLCGADAWRVMTSEARKHFYWWLDEPD